MRGRAPSNFTRDCSREFEPCYTWVAVEKCVLCRVWCDLRKFYRGRKKGRISITFAAKLFKNLAQNRLFSHTSIVITRSRWYIVREVFTNSALASRQFLRYICAFSGSKRETVHIMLHKQTTKWIITVGCLLENSSWTVLLQHSNSNKLVRACVPSQLFFRQW